MADMHSRLADDAPPVTSKRAATRAQAAQELVGADRGDAVTLQCVTIKRDRAELYAFWRDFTNLPLFMENVEAVTPIDPLHSRWVVRAPGGRTVEWVSAVTEEVEGALIAWASVEGADVPNSGRIDFRDAGARGTIVGATILYDPPAGAVGRLIAKMFQREPAIQARRDMRRFKQLMETGEVATGARNRRLLDEGKN